MFKTYKKILYKSHNIALVLSRSNLRRTILHKQFVHLIYIAFWKCNKFETFLKSHARDYDRLDGYCFLLFLAILWHDTKIWLRFRIPLQVIKMYCLASDANKLEPPKISSRELWETCGCGLVEGGRGCMVKRCGHGDISIKPFIIFHSSSSILN